MTIMRRITSLFIVLAFLMLPAARAGAQQQQHLKIVVPQSVIEASQTSQAPPRNAPPKQRKRTFVAAVAVVSALAVLAIVISVKYGD
jgi:hypothetical protein